MGILDAPALNSRGIVAALTNFQSANFLKWKKALVDTRLGTADAKILCVGDSTTNGTGDSTAATVPTNRAWPFQLATLLNTYMVPAAPGLGLPKSLSSSQAADTRWTPDANWALNTQAGDVHLGFGGKGMYYASETANSVLTYADPTITADTFDVYYLNIINGSPGTFTAQATGGAASGAVNEGSPSATGVYKVTVSAAAAATSNVVTITHDAGVKKVYILGVEPYLAGAKKVRLGNAGAAGSATLDWVTYAFGSNLNTYGGLDSIKGYAPHLSIIDLGINDAGTSVAAGTFLSQLQTIITACQVSGDVILKTMLPSSPASGRIALETAYVGLIKGLGLPVIDVYSRIGSWTPYQAAGYMNADGLHGNDYSYGDVAKIVFEALRQI